ncbi:MAG: hypothetical protein CVV60_00410 [Tenericutes bacterium HGW-Tenericutes-5]|nr:MAG: hypothetical protein CVV60_00410 [Tenericutes bacterium HGW-Tenericutes-5]
MSKLLKYGLALLLIGFGVVLMISATSNSTVFGFTDEDYTLHEESYSEDAFNLIDFDFQNRKVYILESLDDEIHVKFYTHEKDMLEFTDTDNELTITIERKWYYNIFSFDIFSNREFFKVYLYLPTTSSVENLKIFSSNGSLNLNVNATFDQINLRTSNGRIDILNLEASNIIANSSNGVIRIDNLSVAEKIDLNTTNGEVIMDDINSPIIEADTSNGKITAKNIISNNINLDTSNGHVYLSIVGEKDDYKVTLSTSNGSKIFDGLEVSSGTINSSGQYSISLDSSNSDVEVTFID